MARLGAAFNPGAAPDAAAVARGQKLFVPTCGFCHGPDASGRSGPDLVASGLVIRDEQGSLIGPVVHNGRPGTAMPAFRSLTAAEIADISAFLHAQQRAAANRFAYSFRDVVTGNPAAGKAYFNGDGGCNACHSPSGDLAGVAARIQPAELQAAMISPPNFRGRRAPGPSERVTVTLPSGETIAGKLVLRDSDTVALVDGQGWYHSYPVQGAKIEVQDPLAAHKALVTTITDTEMHDLLAYLETLK